MKVLMVGMDGASREAFNRGWTPNIDKLISNGTDLGLATDLYSRGWTEIVTGEHALKSTAMYDRPKCDGTVSWKESFSIADIPGLGDTIKPIWQIANEQGYSVGIMNVPTTAPAPPVNGFFIAGGGGGGGVVRTPTAELCFPLESLDVLLDRDYIVDERITQLVVDSKMSKSGQIFDRMSYKNRVRTDCFVEFCNKYNTDFGLLIYKTSSVLAENLVQTDWSKVLHGDSSVDKENLNAIEQYYRDFDTQIVKLRDAFPDAELVLVSDHGMVRRTHSVNPNILLRSHGYQKSNSVNGAMFTVVNKLKGALPFKLKKMLKSNGNIAKIASNSIDFSETESTAFVRTFGDWRYGVYINDAARFNGPVDPDDIDVLSNEIMKLINDNEYSIENNIKANIVDSKELSGETKPGWFPDITIEVPDGYLITDKVSAYVEEYSPDDGVSGLENVLKGNICSIKSSRPLSIYVGRREIREESNRLEKLSEIHGFVSKLLMSENS